MNKQLRKAIEIKILLLAFAFILILGNASAVEQSLPQPIKQGQCGQLIQTCDSSTFANITQIQYSDLSIKTINAVMTKNGDNYNYTFCDTNSSGSYSYVVKCDENGIVKSYPISFDVTGNGKPNASGIVVVLFTILFIILVGLTCYLAVYTLAHLMSLDFDIIDLAFDWGLYFGILALYITEQAYLGDIDIEKYLILFISIGGLLLILVPIIAFILSVTIGTLNKKNIQVRVPQRFSFRRTR